MENTKFLKFFFILISVVVVILIVILLFDLFSSEEPYDLPEEVKEAGEVQVNVDPTLTPLKDKEINVQDLRQMLGEL
jgi:uncharacterized protein YpmS